MSQKNDMPWRPAYEFYSAAGWTAALLVLLIGALAADLPLGMYWYMSVVALGFIVINMRSAWHIWTLKFALSGAGVEYLNIEELKRRAEKRPSHIWLGYGFEWKVEHTQRIHDLKKQDVADFIPPRLFLKTKEKLSELTVLAKKKITGRNSGSGKKIASLDPDGIGAPWIHGVEPNEEDVEMFIENLIGNTLIVGTTRCGKTRLLDVLNSQFIFRPNASIIVFDPKGDIELRENLRRAAVAAGRGKDFHSFHLGFPQKSIRIDPLKNYINLSELASRVSSLVPSDSGAGDAFTAFAWDVSNAIFMGLVECEEKPSLLKLRRYVESGVAGLLAKCYPAYFAKQTAMIPDWEKKANAYISRMRKRDEKTGEFKTTLPNPKEILLGYKLMYEDLYKPNGLISEAVDALSSIYEHDVTHYGKMLANFKPVLAMLTTGEFGPLLSPDASDINDERLSSDLMSLSDSKAIVYIGLNALADKTVAGAVGAMLLSDLTAVAAARQNFRPEKQNKANPVYLTVDEAAQLVNDPYIQMLNMSGSSGFVNIAATQTISDFTARLGSEDKARVMLGNFNNLIALRSKDRATQDFITETFEEFYVKSSQVTKGSNSTTEQNITHFGGGISERVTEVLEEAFPTALLGKMPNWQYIASINGGQLKKGRVPILVGEG